MAGELAIVIAPPPMGVTELHPSCEPPRTIESRFPRSSHRSHDLVLVGSERGDDIFAMIARVSGVGTSSVVEDDDAD